MNDTPDTAESVQADATPSERAAISKAFFVDTHGEGMRLVEQAITRRDERIAELEQQCERWMETVGKLAREQSALRDMLDAAECRIVELDGVLKSV